MLVLALVAGCGDKPGEKSATPAGMAPVPQTAAMDLGRTRYSGVCLGCHGPEGRGQGPFPKLAGRPAAELAAMLKDYRAGKTRGPQSTTMRPFAQPLTDEEIGALADYLAGL